MAITYAEQGQGWGVEHVGDTLRDDIEGARGAGLQALHWGVDATHFSQVRDRVLAEI